MKTEQAKFNLVLALFLIVAGIGLRLAPHPANFAPLAALAIFGGAVLPRRFGLWVPALAMVASDAVIGFYDYRVMAVVWGCFVLTALASSQWLKDFTIKRGAAITLAGSVFFFAATNFAVWVWGSMYAHTLSGLAQCYVAALPFFRNTLLSDLFYTAALFGLYAFATRLASKNLVLKSAGQES
jgi:hypothetical protein